MAYTDPTYTQLRPTSGLTSAELSDLMRQAYDLAAAKSFDARGELSDELSGIRKFRDFNYSPEATQYVNDVAQYSTDNNSTLPTVANFTGSLENQNLLSRDLQTGAMLPYTSGQFEQFAGSKPLADQFSARYDPTGADPSWDIGSVAFDPNSEYRLVDRTTGDVISSGKGYGAAQDILSGASKLYADSGNKANFAIQQMAPGQDWQNINYHDPKINGFANWLKMTAALIALTAGGGALLGAGAGAGGAGAGAAGAAGAGAAGAAGAGLGGLAALAPVAGEIVVPGIVGGGLSAATAAGLAAGAGGLATGLGAFSGGGAGASGGGLTAGSGMGQVGAEAGLSGLSSAPAFGEIVVPGVVGGGLSAAPAAALTAGLGGITAAGLGGQAGAATSSTAGSETAQPSDIVVTANPNLPSPGVGGGLIASPLSSLPDLSANLPSINSPQPSQAPETQPAEEAQPSDIVVTANPNLPPLNMGVPALTAAALGGLSLAGSQAGAATSSTAGSETAQPADTVTSPEAPAQDIVVTGSKSVAPSLGDALKTVVPDLASTLPSLNYTTPPTEAPPSTLDKVISGLKAVSLITSLIGSGGGGGSGTRYTGLGSGNLGSNFSASLPQASLPGGVSSMVPRAVPDQNWYEYGFHPEQSFFNTSAPGYTPQPGKTPGMARGGEFAVRGPGDGRSDSIPARLSDGEYVMDAETVALLGDGSNKAGAEKLDQFRVNLRKQKGRNLARGAFSVKAKRPEAYLAGGRT